MMPGVVRGQTRPEFIALPSTRLPTPSRLAGRRCRRFRLLPGQCPAAGVRNAGRWPGFGSRCGANRIGSTGPADEYPGDAAANVLTGLALQIAVQLGNSAAKRAAAVLLSQRLDDEPFGSAHRESMRRVCSFNAAVSLSLGAGGLAMASKKALACRFARFVCGAAEPGAVPGTIRGTRAAGPRCHPSGVAPAHVPCRGADRQGERPQGCSPKRSQASD